MAKHGKKGRGGRIWRRLGLGLVITVLVVSLLGLGTFLYLYQTTKIPDPNEGFETNTTFIYYDDGTTQLGSLAVQNRETLDYEDIPQLAKDAVISAEDRTFWDNPGFSAPAIARAAWSIASGGEMQGGSTITQQYIKILYLDSERTLKRKVRELMLAIKMGHDVPKEEVLAGYLNTIYFGRGAYGIQAASKSYFLKKAKDLDVAEAATLAAILNNPSAFNPSGGEEHRKRLLGRYRYVLDGMLEMGSITKAQHDEAWAQLPAFPDVPVNNRYGGTKGYLIKMVEDELEELGFPEAQVKGGGLRVTTTIDKKLQDRAVEVTQEYQERAAEDGRDGVNAEDLHIALASTDTATGALLAMVGGPNYVEAPRNWARTPRPAASTFKTYAVIAGLRDGFSLRTRLNGDAFTPRGDTKEIHNQGNREYGVVTLRRALAKSINTAFVDLTEQMDDGPDKIAKAAMDAGAPEGPGWDRHSRLALGFGEVSPVNTANAYATLANGGKRNTAHIVGTVTDREGKVLYRAKAKNEQKVEADVAANVVDALTSVVDEGTGASASELNRPVAGKTGTNGIDDEITSAWFVGMTKQVSTAVMYVAGDGGNGDLVPYRRPGDRTFYGSGYPLETWLDYMRTAVDGMPVEDFDDAPTIRPSKTSTIPPEPEPEPESEPEPEPTQDDEPTATSTPTTEAPSETPSEDETPSETPSETETEAPPETEEPPTQEPTSRPTREEPTEAPTATSRPTSRPTRTAEQPTQQPTAKSRSDEG